MIFKGRAFMGFLRAMKDNFVEGVKQGLEDVKQQQKEAEHRESAELGFLLLMSVWNNLFQPDSKYAVKIAQIKKELDYQRIPILIRAAELVGDPTTPKDLYTISHAYLDAGASVRDKAIDYLERYITAGACWEGTPVGIQNEMGVQRNLRNTEIAHVHISLGQLYEAEYRFDDAMEQYRIASDLCPYDAAGVIGMSNIYIKRGDYEGGIRMFKNVQKSKYYRVYIYRGLENSAFIDSVDRAYNNLLEKQQAGYVYRPRKKKATLPPAGNE